MSVAKSAPAQPESVTAFRFNPPDLPSCAYYALTGPKSETILHVNNACWHDPSSSVPSQKFPVQLWGYDRNHLSELHASSLPIVLTVQIDLTVILQSITFDSDYHRDNCLLLKLRVTSIDATRQLTLVKSSSPAQHSTPSGFSADLQANSQSKPAPPLSPFTNESLLEAIYQPERRLGRVISCQDPIRDITSIFGYIPAFCQISNSQGILPLDYWPHWPKPEETKQPYFPTPVPPRQSHPHHRRSYYHSPGKAW